MVQFESKYAQISWDETLKCVVARWKQFATGKNYQDPMENGLKLLQHQHTAKWLADTRQLGVISRQDQEWVDQTWIPQFVQAGAKYVATVVPEDVLAKMSLDAMTTTANVRHSPIILKSFRTLEEAKTWLNSQGDEAMG